MVRCHLSQGPPGHGSLWKHGIRGAHRLSGCDVFSQRAWRECHLLLVMWQALLYSNRKSYGNFRGIHAYCNSWKQRGLRIDYRLLSKVAYNGFCGGWCFFLCLTAAVQVLKSNPDEAYSNFIIATRAGLRRYNNLHTVDVDSDDLPMTYFVYRSGCCCSGCCCSYSTVYAYN